MGHLATALKNAGYLQNVADLFGKIVQKGRDEKAQQEYNALMDQANNSSRKLYSTQPEDNISFSGNAPARTIPAGNTKLAALLPQGNVEPVHEDPNLPSGVDSNQQPTDITLGDVGGAKYNNILPADQQVSPGELSRQQALVMAKLAQGLSAVKNLSPEQIKSGLTSEKLMQEGYTPPANPKKIIQTDRTKDTWEIDSFGNRKLVQPGETKKQKQTNIGSYTGKDGYHYITMYDPDTNTVRDIRSQHPVKPDKANAADLKDIKSEKWKDFGSYVNAIDYKENKDPFGNTTGLTPTTPEEKQIRRKVALNAAIGNLLPNAANWYKTEIEGKWKRDNISQADFETEVGESLKAGELTPAEAQDLLDFDAYRPYLFDTLTPDAKYKPEGK